MITVLIGFARLIGTKRRRPIFETNSSQDTLLLLLLITALIINNTVKSDC
jgi:hypothetical protein